MRKLITLSLMVLALVGSTGSSCNDDDERGLCRLPIGETCVSNDQCNDGLWCNGPEVCEPWNPAASACGCVRDPRPCGDVRGCHEAARTCISECETNPDADGDGHISIACGGDDCDDSDRRRYPGAIEVCDPEHLDEDCDPTTLGDRDVDGDGYIDVACCNYQPNGSLLCGTDCDDRRASVNPGQAEVCNGIDNDCNGLVDDGVTVAMYRDEDRDGHGAGPAQQLCAGTPGYSTLDNDCDDTSPGIKPGAIRCTGEGGAYDLCNSDGTYSKGECRQGVCVPQPGGHGICPY
jgi:hypothetical protein